MAVFVVVDRVDDWETSSSLIGVYLSAESAVEAINQKFSDVEESTATYHSAGIWKDSHSDEAISTRYFEGRRSGSGKHNIVIIEMEPK